MRQARTCLPAEGESDLVLDGGQPHRSARPRHDNLGQAFREDLARTAVGSTAKAPDLNAQNGNASLPR